MVKRRHLEQLIIDRGAIQHRYWRSARGWTEHRIPLADIVRISIKTDPRHLRNKPDLVIEGHNREIRIGWWLLQKSKRGLKKLLLSIIAEAGRKSAKRPEKTKSGDAVSAGNF